VPATGRRPLIEQVGEAGVLTPVESWVAERVRDDPLPAEIADYAFDGETVRTAVGAVVALVELLRPHVEPHLEPGANLASGLS
jgi:hypothetical protein